MTAIAVVYHSVSGRTKALAEAVARGAQAIDGTTVDVIAVDRAAAAATVLARADAIVFGCPTYMGSASAAFKAFMDSTAAVWALQGWRDKLAAGFTHSAALSGDKLGTLTQLAVFAAQHGMVWIGLGLPPTYVEVGGAGDTNRLGSHLGAMAQSAPGTALSDGDLHTAEHLGRRVARCAARWGVAALDERAAVRHPTAATWVFPPADRPALGAGLDRINLREIVARPERFEHHLVPCATIGAVQLEVTAASEPLYFGHVNISDEYALTLPTGDDLVDKFPLRTFISDPATGGDVARYNHRNGDLVLHPLGWMHWPGKLRPPYEMFEIPPGMRRCGLSIVYCATTPTISTASEVPIAADRVADAKRYGDAAPAMVLTALRGEGGTVAAIGHTTLELVVGATEIVPPCGGWVVVLDAASGSPHLAADLIRIAPGASLDARGIARALVFASPSAGPDLPPASWRAIPEPPFAPFEDRPRGALPLAIDALMVTERSPSLVALAIRGVTVDVPRHWLARTLFRLGLHDLRLGYVEAYGGVFVDDHAGTTDHVHLGVRTGARRERIAIPRVNALAVIESLYRAIAPSGYVERLV